MDNLIVTFLDINLVNAIVVISFRYINETSRDLADSRIEKLMIYDGIRKFEYESYAS